MMRSPVGATNCPSSGIENNSELKEGVVGPGGLGIRDGGHQRGLPADGPRAGASEV